MDQSWVITCECPSSFRKDPYKEVANKANTTTVTCLYNDPIELERACTVYIYGAEHPSTITIDDTTEETIGGPRGDHTNNPADGEDGDDEPSDDDDDDDIARYGEKEDETQFPSWDTKGITVRLKPPMSASMEARIAKHVAAPIPPTSPAYDQAPLGHRAADNAQIIHVLGMCRGRKWKKTQRFEA
ncbi:hypothetical protein Tco_0491500 [Tanacetum coccineum]